MLYQSSIRFFIALCLVVMPAVMKAQAVQPEEIIETTHDKIITILSDKELTEDTQRFKSQLIIQPRVDADALSREVLSDYWADMGSRDQLAASNSLRIIAFNEIWLVLREYQGETLEGFRFEATDDQSGTVHSALTSSDGKTIDLIFSMHQVKSGWFIRDLIIDDNSVIEKFRSRYLPIAKEKGIRGVLKSMKKEMRGFKDVIKKLQQADETAQ